MKLTKPREGFLRLEHSLLDGFLKFLEGDTLKVYLSLRCLNYKKLGHCFPSLKHLSDMTGFSIKKVRIEIDRLIKFNMIKKKSGKKKRIRNEYWYVFPYGSWRIIDKQTKRIISFDQIENQWSNRREQKI